MSIRALPVIVEDGSAVARRLLRTFASHFEITRSPAEARATVAVALVMLVLLGGLLRFWGLGAVGLHGDEETMAMPTMHIVEDGSPILPSGMFYPRAIVQLYLMAGSVMAFGESEWAMRVPSALCGMLLILLAYAAGRRFLTPTWSLALAACVALLPVFIVDAQTARMYTFLVSCVAGFLILLFKWESTDRLRYLVAAVLVMLFGLQFHTLAIFAALACLYPGLVQGDLRRLVIGCVALGAIGAGFVAIDAWVDSAYPQRANVDGLDGIADRFAGPQAGAAIPEFGALALALAAAVAAGVATMLVRDARSVRSAVAAGALITLGLLAQFAFSYHIAGIALVAGFVVARRNGGLSGWRMGVFVALAAAIAVAQLLVLRANGVDSMRQALGALTGWPSVWPYLVIGKYSAFALLLCAVGLVAAVWALVNRRRMPDHVLFAVLALWLPLMIIGLFKWNIPFRYAAAQALPLLLVGFAVAQWLTRSVKAQAVVAAAVCVLAVNPLALSRTVNSGYAIHPDHKGAAEFIKSVQLGPRDVLIAEDVLQQTYYLGRVDYWLVGKHIAAPFVIQDDGELHDFYTHTRLIGTGEELKRIIDQPDRGDLYILGSGEDQEDGRRYQRSFGIYEILESPRLRVMYHGRDGTTKVWKIPAGVRSAAVTR